MKQVLVSVLGCVALQMGLASRAAAQAPVYPYDTAAPIVPADRGDDSDDDDGDEEAPPPGQAAGGPPPMVAPAPAIPPPPAQPIPAAPQSTSYVAPPQGYYPPPPGYYAPPQPQRGHYPPPPGYQPNGFAPPPGYAPPAQYSPPPGYMSPPPPPRRTRHHAPPRFRPPARDCTAGSCATPPPKSARTAKAEGKARYFSIGARVSVLGINQSIGDKGVVLGGGGVEMRLRTKGRFGVELSLDVIRGEFGLNGPIGRTSMPLQLNLMVYVFPNTDDRIFNLYFLAGGGFSRTTMTLVDPWWNEVQQNFHEWTIQGGLGLELRFRWFALRADARAMGLFRDNRMLPTRNYIDVEGAPVPNRSVGGQGTLGAAFWF